MKKYEIYVEYTTGNSFGSHLEDMTVELKWDKLEVAKENLRRIKEHDEWQRFMEHPGYSTTKDQIRSRDVAESLKDWYVPYEGRGYGRLKLYSDDGEFLIYSAPWYGYFESLEGARIQLVDPLEDESGMEIGCLQN